MLKLTDLTESFAPEAVPSFPCPLCGSSLSLLPKGLTWGRSAESTSLLKFVYDPDHDVGFFVLRLECSSGNCRESVACIGKYHCSLGFGSSAQLVVDKALDPLFFYPTVPIFQIPADVPAEIAEQLRQSFSLFWSNPNAAANSLRVAVEAMMDFRHVRKTTVNANGKRVHLTLHSRIVEFKNSKADLGEKLMAIKWLGNSGSHLTGISKKRLYDGYRLVHYVIEEMFEDKKRNLDKLAKTIIRRKGRA